MNSELQQAARTAWAAMIDTRGKLQRMVDQMAGENRGPMPPGLALDMVQEHTGGDRDDAVTALLNAGADWLEEQSQPSETGEIGDGCMCDARLVLSYLREELPASAAVYLAHISERCDGAVHPQATAEDRHAATGWRRWVAKALHVIGQCQLIALAAYPDAPAEAA